MISDQFYLTLFATVFFCLGYRLVTDEGNIGYFIRKPFEGLYDELEMKREHFINFHPNSMQVVGYYLKRLLLLIVTPLILCITCMASIWGITVFVALNGITRELAPYLIINCFSASFIQTLIWSLYVKYIQ